MNFTQPLWLLLILPAGLLVWNFPMPNRVMRYLRIVTYITVILAISGLRIKLPGHNGITVVIADRSASMPQNAEQNQKEIINILGNEMGSQHQLAVISFAEHAVIEQLPIHSTFSRFQQNINPHNSDISDAIAKAQQLIPHNTPGRILLLSDGLWSGKDPITEALHCSTRNIAIDYRPMTRPSANDLYIHQISTPQSVPVNQGFYINAWIGVNTRSEVEYKLTRNNQTISSGIRNFSKGIHKITFRDKVIKSQTADYRLSITSGQPDPIPENNNARFLVSTKNKPAILLISETSGNGLEKLLSGTGLTVNKKPPSSSALELTSLAGMRCVILENIPASKLSEQGMQNLRQWIETTGHGMLITGGKHSFGAGGYFKSPLDPILPVSMELRKEHRKFAMAIVIVLDRSGSMGVHVNGGKTKMDLANMGTVQVLDLMSDMDEIGVIAVDSAPHNILNICTADKAREKRGKILNIESEGGGIYIYEGLKAAVNMLTSAQADTRHIILFADAADSEKPENYEQLLTTCRKYNTTCSVVALGDKSDSDAALLEDIARTGGGRALFTTDPTALPRLFAQDTFAVARSTFLKETTPIKKTSNYSLISGSFDAPTTFTIDGYNLCYLRNGAFIAAQTLDEYKAPIIAGWNASAGRVAAYTGEADGKYTGAIATSTEYEKMLTSITRWCAGENNPLSDGMVLRTQIINGNYRIKLWLDPDRKKTALTTLPTVKLLRSEENKPTIQENLTFQWQNADLLTAEIPIKGNDIILPIVYITGQSPQPLPPVTLPYSSEYKPQQFGKGIETLKKLANITGGTERLQLNKIWDTLPEHTTYKSLQPWLILLSLIIFLLEIIIRRGTLPNKLTEKLNSTSKSTLNKHKSDNIPEPHPQSTNTETNSAFKKAALRSKERLRR